MTVGRPVVVDTSVAYKWLAARGEHSVEEAELLLDQHESGEIELVAPITLHVEIANALRCNSYLTAERTLDLVGQLPAFGICLYALTPARLQEATALAYRHGISVYDALFLALAEELDCPLVTADRRAFEGTQSAVEIRLL